MKIFVLFALLINSSAIYAYTTNFGENIINISGLAYYTVVNHNKISQNNNYSGFLNISLSNKYYSLSSQIASNKYNILRRLELNVPLYTENKNMQISASAGRMNIGAGLLNTTTTAPTINGLNALPLTVYDTRRYETNPDTIDGFRLKIINTLQKKYTSELNLYIGQMMIDQPFIPIYTNVPFPAKMFIDPRTSESINWTFTDDINFKIKYSYTNENVYVKKFEPPLFSSVISTPHVNQQTHLFGIKYMYDDWTFQTEMSYRKINISPDIYGIYGMISKHFEDLNLRTFIGYSYGTRDVDSHIHDAFIGAEYTLSPFKLLIEYHKSIADNWRFYAAQPLDYQTNTLLTTISLEF